MTQAEQALKKLLNPRSAREFHDACDLIRANGRAWYGELVAFLHDPANDRKLTQTKIGVAPKAPVIDTLFALAPLEAVETLAFLADNPDCIARYQYAYRCLRTGFSRALDIAGKLLTDADWHVRAGASIGLRDAVTGYRGATEPAYLQRVKPLICEALRRFPDRGRRF